MRRMILACSVLLALSANASAGQIYKWTDAQGNVHFGSQPPEGQQASAVNPNISQPKAPTQPKPSTTAGAQDEVQEKLDRAARKEAAEKEAERKTYCDRIRQDLAQMKANPRVRIEDNGELRRLTEEERQDRISKSEASIKENCQ